MADEMLLKTQQWLNRTYGQRAGFGSVDETGTTGWDTVYGLIRALQIELGITATANNFGPGTQSRFKAKYPNGITDLVIEQHPRSNIYAIIQGALWCKGYPAVYGGITQEFSDEVKDSILDLKRDMGFEADSTVDLDIMMCLLSMKQFKLLEDYGGKVSIRSLQQYINRNHRAYTGIVPTDGLYGREMNTALIQVLQKLEGFSPDEATGYFGNGTRSRLQTVGYGGSNDWVWLVRAALICNGSDLLMGSVWTSHVTDAVKEFQQRHALPITGAADRTTWMSLLTSKGDPDRACIACDTRFEITDEFAKRLKSDGYQIVGRYLTEPNQENLSESNYFKALRTGELERIVSHGLKYFPIFQEYSTRLSNFTEAEGVRHANEAQAAARRLGVPPTVIYFAVDYDATDPEISSNIIPYFRGVAKTLRYGYTPGIYASRNVCTRVINTGFAFSAFVSDMSTGFSGNLGFTIPRMWNYDQFTEISGYAGKWDLDRVAYSGRYPACDRVDNMQEKSDPIVDWTKRVISRYSYASDNRQPDFLIGRFILESLRKPKYWDGIGEPWRAYTPETNEEPLFTERNIMAQCCKNEGDIAGAMSSVDIPHFAASSLGYATWGTKIHYAEIGLGDFGGWAFDLLQLWGDYLGSQTTQSLEQYANQYIGSNGGAFSWLDLVADADAFLLIDSYWINGTTFAEALLNLRSLETQNRLYEFFRKRFGGDAGNVSAAFWSLIYEQKDNEAAKWLFELIAGAKRLPNQEESKILAHCFAAKLSRL